MKDQSQEPKGMDIFEIDSLPELSADKKMEVCMNCTEMFDINHIGCICPTCFLGGENGTLDAEVFMNGCNIIPDASNEDGHDAWTKESVLMLMQLFHKAQEPKVNEEELNDLVDKRFVEFADITYKEGIKIGLSMKEREQTEVGEELQYQNLTCLVNGFELNLYQKELAKQEYKKLLAMKEREAVDNDMEFLLAWWMGKGDEYRNKTLFSDAIKDYDQSKIAHYPFYF